MCAPRPRGQHYINWGGPGQTQMGLLVAGLRPNFIKSIWCITTEAQPLALPLQTTRVVEMRDPHRLAYYIRERDTRNIYRAETTMSKQRCICRAAGAAFVHPSFDRDRPVTRNTFRIIYIYMRSYSLESDSAQQTLDIKVVWKDLTATQKNNESLFPPACVLCTSGK